MQPLQRFGPPRAQKCNPYCVFGLRGTKNVTPIALWAPEGPKMQHLLRFRAPGGEKCDPYKVFEAPGPKTATPIAFSASGGRTMRPLQCLRPSKTETCNPYCVFWLRETKHARAKFSKNFWKKFEIQNFKKKLEKILKIPKF